MVTQSIFQESTRDSFNTLKYKRKSQDEFLFEPFGSSPEFQPTYLFDQNINENCPNKFENKSLNFYHQLRQSPLFHTSHSTYKLSKKIETHRTCIDRPSKRCRFSSSSTFNGVGGFASKDSFMSYEDYQPKFHESSVIDEKMEDNSTPSASNKTGKSQTPWWKSGFCQSVKTSKLLKETGRISQSDKVCENKQCYVCQCKPSSGSRKQMKNEISSKPAPQRQNSLLSYFKPAIGNSNLNNAIQHKKESASSSMSDVANTMLETCSFCDHTACSECIHTCHSCQKMFCSFCTTTNYESQRDVHIFCLDCADHHQRDNGRADSFANEELSDMIID